MSSDEAAVATFADILEELKITHDVRRGQIFGNIGMKLGKRMIAACLNNGHLLVKLPPEQYDEAMQLQGVQSFAPDGSPMTGWLEIPHDYAELWREYTLKSLRYIQSLPPPKPRKSRRKKG